MIILAKQNYMQSEYNVKYEMSTRKHGVIQLLHLNSSFSHKNRTRFSVHKSTELLCINNCFFGNSHRKQAVFIFMPPLFVKRDYLPIQLKPLIYPVLWLLNWCNLFSFQVTFYSGRKVFLFHSSQYSDHNENNREV